MGRVAQIEPSSLALADNGADLKVSPITHAAVAQLCVACLRYDNAARSTLTAMCVASGDGSDSYEPLLAAVRPDTRAFAPSLLSRHLLAVRVGGTGLLVAASLVLAGALSAARALVGAVVALALG